MNGVLGWIVGVLALVIPGLGPAGAPSWNGYVEDDYTYAAAPSAGTIATIAVQEGQAVKAGDVLFALEASAQQAQLAAAKAQADAARATLANLTTGARPEEIAVTTAQLQKAQSDLVLAQQNLSRTSDLFAHGNTPQSAVDAARSAAQSAQAAADALQAQIDVAELPARPQQQQAAAAQLTAAEAQVTAAETALDQRTVTAPTGGRVARLFFKAGEVAAAGAPVLSLSAPGALKIEFYVNEADRPGFALGDRVSVSCDGCAAGLTATVSFFASDPQFTPPIIYSRDERSRLVFLTEAVMDQPDGVRPGQPVSIGKLK